MHHTLSFLSDDLCYWKTSLAPIGRGVGPQLTNEKPCLHGRWSVSLMEGGLFWTLSAFNGVSWSEQKNWMDGLLYVQEYILEVSIIFKCLATFLTYSTWWIYITTLRKFNNVHFCNSKQVTIQNNKIVNVTSNKTLTWTKITVILLLNDFNEGELRVSPSLPSIKIKRCDNRQFWIKD